MEEKESIILGDFNCNVLEINETPHTSKLTSLYDEYQYTQLIKQPTRITSSIQTLQQRLIAYRVVEYVTFLSVTIV